MRIAYKATAHNFLAEGLYHLEELGIKIFPLEFQKDATFQESLNACCPKADLVIIELFGTDFIPTDIAYSGVPTVAYGVDSTINLYLYKYLFRLFDYVFVDQKSARDELLKLSLKAHFLPLSIDEKYFREINENPEHNLTFVGRNAPTRKKRANLVSYLERNTDIALFSHVSLDEMQDIFANSRMCLNENLFSGLTYRVFQALAAGTILLNEENMDGVNDFFEHKVHYISYNPDNLLNIIRTVKQSPEKFAHIAKAGQDECRRYHTTKYRVKQLFSKLLECELDEVEGKLTKSISLGERLFRKVKKITDTYDEDLLYDAMYSYNYLHAYGGNLSLVIMKLKKLSENNDKIGAKACSLLSRFFASAYDTNKSLNYHHKAIEIIENMPTHAHKGVLPACLEFSIAFIYADLYCTMTLFYMSNGLITEAERTLDSALELIHATGYKLIPYTDSHNGKKLPDKTPYREVEMYFIVAQIYASVGNIFDLGFQKPADNVIYTNALETAFVAWGKYYNTDILDFILKHSATYKIEGELLGKLTNPVRRGYTTQKQKETILKIAKSYYNFDILK